MFLSLFWFSCRYLYALKNYATWIAVDHSGSLRLRLRTSERGREDRKQPYRQQSRIHLRVLEEKLETAKSRLQDTLDDAAANGSRRGRHKPDQTNS